MRSRIRPRAAISSMASGSPPSRRTSAASAGSSAGSGGSRRTWASRAVNSADRRLPAESGQVGSALRRRHVQRRDRPDPLAGQPDRVPAGDQHPQRGQRRRSAGAASRPPGPGARSTASTSSSAGRSASRAGEVGQPGHAEHRQRRRRARRPVRALADQHPGDAARVAGGHRVRDRRAPARSCRPRPARPGSPTGARARRSAVRPARRRPGPGRSARPAAGARPTGRRARSPTRRCRLTANAARSRPAGPARRRRRGPRPGTPPGRRRSAPARRRAARRWCAGAGPTGRAPGRGPSAHPTPARAASSAWVRPAAQPMPAQQLRQTRYDQPGSATGHDPESWARRVRIDSDRRQPNVGLPTPARRNPTAVRTVRPERWLIEFGWTYSEAQVAGDDHALHLARCPRRSPGSWRPARTGPPGTRS